MQPFSCASRSLYLPECIQSDLELRSPQSRSVSEQNVLPSVMQRTVSVCTLGSFHLASPMYFFFFYMQMQHQWSYSSAYQESLPPPVFLPIRAVQRRKRKDSKDSLDSCFVPYVRGRPPNLCHMTSGRHFHSPGILQRPISLSIRANAITPAITDFATTMEGFL